MNKVTGIFVVLLGLATLASGQLWLRGKALTSGRGTGLDAGLAILSAAGLALALLALGRILYRTAPAHQAGASEHQEEEKDA